MSVLLRIEGDFVLLCKGADNSMMPLCNKDQFHEQCGIHIDMFASTGLRTLVLAKRVLTEREANIWLGEFHAASNSLVNRPQMLSRCAVNIEQNLQLIGAVGIEDELQVRWDERSSYFDYFYICEYRYLFFFLLIFFVHCNISYYTYYVGRCC
jgi:magnesium-transporting ATPase (P-type)